MRKNLAIILIALLSLTACGGDTNEDLQPQQEVVVQDSIPTLKGEFIFLSDAAVFKGDTFVYGVKIDTLSKKLAKEVEAYKEDQFDMIPVTLKVKIVPNPGMRGWDEFIEIREVLSISAPKEEAPTESASN